MALVSWQALTEIERMRHQFDRMFGDLAGFDSPLEARGKPAIELSNSEDNLTLRAEIPGINPEDLDIGVSSDGVIIKGERRYENAGQENDWYHSEFSYGRFERSIRFPEPVQNDRVQADYQNGILTLTLPKLEDGSNRVFKVNLDPANRGLKATASNATNSPNNS